MNPQSPFNTEGFDSQIIYKLATIETQVQGLNNIVQTAVARLEDKIVESSKLMTGEVESVKKRVVQLEAEVKFLQDWRNQLFTKLGFLVSGVSVFWLVFGKNVETMVASIF